MAPHSMAREQHCWGMLYTQYSTVPVTCVNTLRLRQNGRHFPDDIFKWIFLNENVWISINISLKFVPRGPINNIPALVQIMASCRPGDKPLSEPMLVSLPMHICVTQPQWVKNMIFKYVIENSSWDTHCEFKLLKGEWHRTSLMKILFHQIMSLSHNELTHCGLVMSWCNMDLDQHWFR